MKLDDSLHPSMPTVSLLERQRLVEIQQNYLYQSEDVMHESAVKMVVLSPLFTLAGFYRPHPSSTPVEVQGTTSG